MGTNQIYIRLRQECNQAVLSDSRDLVLKCMGKAKMAHELGAVNPEDFNELNKILTGEGDGRSDFKRRMAAYAQACHRMREERANVG